MIREKKVLVIAYYFPPMGMGGVQRVAKFTKYLHSFGWKPHILTVKEVQYLARDSSLLEDVPPEVEITRTGSFDLLRLWFVLKRVFRKNSDKDKPVKAYSVGASRFLSWIFFPDNKIGWIPFALMKGLSLCRRERFDLIFSTSPPPSLHLTGCLLKVLTGIPWVADFRDPWVGYKFQSFPTPLHRFLRKRLERLIVNRADRVIAANPAITRELQTHNPHAENIQLVNQGYDEADFQTYHTGLPDVFNIGYLGRLSPDCDPEPIFAALQRLIEQEKIPTGRVRFVHVGLSVGIDIYGLIERYGLKEIVELLGYLPHREALKVMSRVSLLLLITSADPLVFPAKAFEYLRLEKPVLGIVPLEGEAARFLEEMKLGKVVSPEDKRGIAEALRLCFCNHCKGQLASEADQRQVRKFERRRLTLRLALIFNRVAGMGDRAQSLVRQ
jgi:glycosyltransferase involved in cell wall biosynthesis